MQQKIRKLHFVGSGGSGGVSFFYAVPVEIQKYPQGICSALFGAEIVGGQVAAGLFRVWQQFRAVYVHFRIAYFRQAVITEKSPRDGNVYGILSRLVADVARNAQARFCFPHVEAYLFGAGRKAQCREWQCQKKTQGFSDIVQLSSDMPDVQHNDFKDSVNTFLFLPLRG